MGHLVAAARRTRFGELEPGDVVLDSFGIMHEADQGLTFQLRAKTTAPDKVLLLQFHSLLTIYGFRR
jgi:hypothetical protein